MNDEVFRLLVENVTDYAIFLLDTNGYVKSWNTGARRLKQYEAHEIIGKHFSTFYTQEDIDNKKPENELRIATETGRSEDDFWRVRKDGTLFWASVIITAIYDGNKRLIGFGKVTKDLTERKEAEERIINAHKDASNLKSQFLATASHELRTPLNGVVAVAALLMETPLNNEQKDLVNIIYESGQDLVTIINDILDYSKIEANKLVLTFSDFNLRDLIHRVVNVYKVVTSKPIQFLINIASDVPQLVRGDATRLHQVLLNLVDNAVKFTMNGHVSVALNNEKQDQTGKVKISISVSDTGIGMPPEAMDRLFTPFTQVDPSATKKFKGTGLGLSICKRLIELMEGDINVSSQVSEGSTFTFSVMLYKSLSTTNNTSPSLKNLMYNDKPEVKILIAEDNIINQKVIIKILHRLGYTSIDIAKDGLQAVKNVQGQQYDVVLMDVFMPIMDGITASKEIKKISNIPIIAMTANTLQEDVNKCIQAGMDDYIAKPIDIVHLSVLLFKYTHSAL